MKFDSTSAERLPELAYATWEWMKFDNARANLANETLTALCEFIGCLVDAGPKYGPDERPYIERFFGTIASRLSSRSPGYTGSHPRDPRRALSDPKGDLRLYVSFDELEELVEYAIASYNGTPHGGLNDVTPLEAIGYFVRGKQTLVTWLAEHHRRTLCLMQSARRCRVRGYLDQRVRPHINLNGARYTNRVLATSTHLIGQQLLVYMNTDNLRCVRAFLSDGAELGVLDVQGSWRLIPHDLKVRQQILKQAGVRRQRGAGAPDPIGAYVQEKLAGAKTARKAATELASVSRLIAAAPAATTPPGRARQPETVATLAPDAMAMPVAQTDSRADRAAVAAARPRKLSIGTGQVF